jgi:Common central domain of tyrosinase
MKADIINPGAPVNQRYSRWDQYVAIHWMIQQAFAPGVGTVNFGHGGTGAYSFLSWHRYFLYQFEKQLQSYVPGVMLSYWDWTDPVAGGILVDDFLGPNGTINNEVRSGYFAPSAPTPLPSWWPPGLSGWILPSFFGGGSGALRRRLRPVSGLPDATDLGEALAMSTYPAFQLALETGVGLSDPFQDMHNGLHGWIGGGVGQMGNPAYSPFDPIFYLHHCNIDRLWAMWQMDGHADEYPASGGNVQHRRNDIVYPWTGGAAGFGTTASIASFIPMPDFSAVGAKHNVDTLDFRNEFDYTYDTIPIIGLGLDRTGSMTGMTPDPMTTSSPDVTKWEAAKRGISAFLQDCETVQSSGIAYVMAGIKTFRRLAANDFATVFSAPGYGLIKNGSTFSRATFESNVAGMSPGGSTPLADALQDVQDTLVEPPFGNVPIDEQRYLAMLTDGLLTSGSPMNSIPDHSFSQTAVFAMGFGTGADVDYATLASIVAKGKTLGTQQIFYGENAGTIDKFYSNSLAQAIGFSPIIDPVLELFAGEHVHIDFLATSAEDVFLITVQGMDFNSENWTIHLYGPGGYMAYGEGIGHSHTSMGGHEPCLPEVTATRANGRLSMLLDRNNADYECWVGQWRLMIAYKARTMDAMVMPTIGELIIPVSAVRYTVLVSPSC